VLTPGAAKQAGLTRSGERGTRLSPAETTSWSCCGSLEHGYQCRSSSRCRWMPAPAAASTRGASAASRRQGPHPAHLLYAAADSQVEQNRAGSTTSFAGDSIEYASPDRRKTAARGHHRPATSARRPAGDAVKCPGHTVQRHVDAVVPRRPEPPRRANPHHWW